MTAADSQQKHGTLARLRRSLGVIGLGPRPTPPRFGWNLPEDTAYAHKLPAFKSVLHVFHGQWLGIRAAAGSLPGEKLAIDASGKLSRKQADGLVAEIGARKLTRIVAHGMSDSAALLVRRLSAAGLAEQTFLVHHGALTQWCYEPERKLEQNPISLHRVRKTI